MFLSQQDVDGGTLIPFISVFPALFENKNPEGTQIWFGQGKATQAWKSPPTFMNHFGRKKTKGAYFGGFSQNICTFHNFFEKKAPHLGVFL